MLGLSNGCESDDEEWNQLCWRVGVNVMVKNEISGRSAVQRHL